MTCRKISGLTALALTFMFAACGGDSGSNADEKLAVVSSIDRLDDCTDKLEGDTVFVKSEKADYICKSGKWVNADSSAAQSAKDSSYKQDSSAYVQPPVVAIKNKSITGFSQKGPFVTGTAVKVYELDGKTYAQTGKSFTGKITSDDGKFKVSNVSLASQYALLEANGYFRNEITGEKSKGVITLYAITDLSDRKNVNINLLTHLEYERVLYLVGTGINVPAAKKQAEAEILKAFGISGNFESSEDLDIFSKGEGNAALLAISVMMLGGLGDDSEKSSEAKLTERLAKFAADIEEDGTWDDEKTKAAIADWIRNELAHDWEECYYEVSHFSRITENIEEWELGDVPDFEKYARTFWYSNYGLGECNKNNEGKVQGVTNRYSDSFEHRQFICEKGFWRTARNIEADLYKSGKEKGSDGELWVGPVTGNTYKYDMETGKWDYASARESSLKTLGYDFGGCTAKREGSVVTTIETRCDSFDECYDYEYYEMVEQGQSRTCPKGTIKYVCKGTDIVMTNCPRREYDWEAEWDIPASINFLSGYKVTDGEFFYSKGVYPKGETYLYDEGLDKWFVTNDSYYYDNRGACTSKRRGEIVQDEYNNQNYICKETGIPDYGQYSEYYSTFSWTYADERERLYGICDPSKEGQITDDLAYICSDGRWKEPTENEMLRAVKEKHWGPCNSSNEGQLSSDGTQKCQDGLWHFYVGLIDDFGDDNNVAENAYPGIWFLGKSDNVSFSNSLDKSRWSYDVVRTAGKNSYAAMENISGITHSDSHVSESYANIGLTFLYETYGMLGILSNCSSIQYDYKGSGHEVNAYDNNSDVGWWPEVNFSNEWKTITLSVEDLEGIHGLWNQVTSLSWTVSSYRSQEDIGTYLYIDNVKCIP